MNVICKHTCGDEHGLRPTFSLLDPTHSYGTSRRASLHSLLTSLLRWACKAMLLGFEGTGAKKATAGAARRKKLRTRMVCCVELGRGNQQVSHEDERMARDGLSVLFAALDCRGLLAWRHEY